MLMPVHFSVILRTAQGIETQSYKTIDPHIITLLILNKIKWLIFPLFAVGLYICVLSGSHTGKSVQFYIQLFLIIIYKLYFLYL